MESLAGDEERARGRVLGAILVGGLAARLVMAGVVQGYAQRVGKLCVFGDTFIYWDLARTIREGLPFVVDQSGVPHYALRTPGYPAFLAACQAAFGVATMPVRVVQAVLGIGGVAALFGLVRRALPERGRGTAVVAAGIAAFEPYGIGLGELILSEGLFVPLMMLGLWGIAGLWTGDDRGRAGWRAVGVGAVHGAAILVRPSWAIAVPLLLCAWVVGTGKGEKGRAMVGAVLVAAGVAGVMTPWWVRNERVFGRFVPTAVWVGASLYDGLSPTADGSSAMEFLAEPGVVELGETEQDAELRRRAVAFARAEPGRAIALAAIKAGRYWSPWPNAEAFRSRAGAWASAAVTIPLFALVAVGACAARRDGRALVLLGGPVVYFMLLHLIFVSSIRYRIPGILPALGLAAVGVEEIRKIIHR